MYKDEHLRIHHFIVEGETAWCDHLSQVCQTLHSYTISAGSFLIMFSVLSIRGKSEQQG